MYDDVDQCLDQPEDRMSGKMMTVVQIPIMIKMESRCKEPPHCINTPKTLMEMKTRMTILKSQEMQIMTVF